MILIGPNHASVIYFARKALLATMPHKTSKNTLACINDRFAPGFFAMSFKLSVLGKNI